MLASYDSIEADDHERELHRWHDYIEALPEHEADAALHALGGWWLLFDGLWRADGEAEP